MKCNRLHADLQKELNWFFREQIKSWRPRSVWFEQDPRISAYIRAGNYAYLPSGRFAMAIGLSNITIRVGHRRQGLFGSLLTFLEANAQSLGYEIVRVEEVLRPELCDYLERRGYHRLRDTRPPTYVISTEELRK